jgi:hypothetical protein
MVITTTHDPRGGGRPRLIFVMHGFTQDRQEQREFDLLPGVTTIGSASDADLCLAGLDDCHAEIRRDEADEYTYFHLGPRSGSTVHGGAVGQALLRTSAIIVAGDWTMSYYREEFADHGRPYGGRSGGELARQRRQVRPRLAGTSSTGGQDRHGLDPGEYFQTGSNLLDSNDRAD